MKATRRRRSPAAASSSPTSISKHSRAARSRGCIFVARCSTRSVRSAATTSPGRGPRVAPRVWPRGPANDDEGRPAYGPPDFQWLVRLHPLLRSQRLRPRHQYAVPRAVDVAIPGHARRRPDLPLSMARARLLDRRRDRISHRARPARHRCGAEDAGACGIDGAALHVLDDARQRDRRGPRGGALSVRDRRGVQLRRLRDLLHERLSRGAVVVRRRAGHSPPRVDARRARRLRGRVGQGNSGTDCLSRGV